MGVDSMYALVDGLIFVCGLYVIYHYILMVRSGALRKSPILPKEVDVTRCKDVAGFIRFTGTKQLIFGIIAVLGGTVGLIQDFTGKIGIIPYLISVGIFVVYAFWFGMQVKKATQMFW